MSCISNSAWFIPNQIKQDTAKSVKVVEFPESNRKLKKSRKFQESNPTAAHVQDTSIFSQAPSSALLFPLQGHTPALKKKIADVCRVCHSSEPANIEQ